MILSFDKFERYEMPQVTLCNPNSRCTEVDGKITITDTVGMLSNPSGMNLKLNFNAPHELSFDYYRHKSNDPIKQSFYDSIYEAIQTDRYIYLTDIGYFIISSVTDSDEDNIDKKSIACKSCEENELATAEGLHLKEGTYYLHTDNKDGLLDLFLPKTAGWTMGYIDPSLLTKPYFVEDTEVDNGYNFLYTTIQDMFECIVEPDIIKRTISVYSRVYYAEHHLTDIHIAKYNLLKHKVVEENDEDKYTALNVQGKDENLEIRAVNPTGKNVIYNFEPRYAWMSPALQDAVTRWQEKCESVEDEYLTLQQGYYNDMQNIVFPLEQDIKVLELQLKQQQQTRDLIVIGEQDKAIDIVDSLPQTGKSDVIYFIPTTENNYEEYVWENDSWKYIDLIQVDDISDTNQQRALDLVNAAINNTNATLSKKQSNLDDEKNKIQTNYSERIDQINSECALETTDIFTTELRNELMTHIKPTDYVDEYMLVTESMTYPQRFEKAKELMDRAKSQLVKISSGQKSYSIDTRSFLFNKQFKHFSEQLCAGAIIYVETKNDIMEQLHLTGIDINFDEKSTNFTLGNKYDRSDLKALYDEALGQNSKSFSELKYIASIIEEQQKQLDYQRNWVADLRTLTLDNVLTSEDQAIEINNRGLIGRKRQLNADGSWKEDENGNPLFELEQVKLINNALVFTKDNWEHAEAAIGKIAVGYNSDGSVKYDYGMNGRVIIGELILGNNLVLTGTGAGIKIKDKNGNNAFYADDNGNLVLSGTIFANSGKIGGWTLGTRGNSYVLYSAPTSGMPGVGMAATSLKSDPVFYAGYIGSQSGDTPWDYNKDSGSWRDYTPFYVTQSGELYSTSGKIGGWTIKDGYLEATHTSGGYSYQVFLQSNLASTINAIAVKKINNSTNSQETIFSVNKYGKLLANDADIKGKITADEGKIGGWDIIGNAIDKTFTSSGHTYKACMQGSTNTATAAFLVQKDGANQFYVTYGGSLYAKNANITGTITATSGSFTGTLTANSVIAQGVYFGGNKYLKLTENTNNQQVTLSHTNTTQADMRLLFSQGYIELGRNLTYVSVNAGSQLTPNGQGALVGTWVNSSGVGITSDQNLKNNINPLNGEKYDEFYDKIEPVTFYYNDGTSGRKHTGFIAQQIEKSIIESGLSTNDYALTMKMTDPQTGSESYYLRYTEIIAFNTWQIQRTKSRITELENTVAELKTQLQTLTAG